MNAFSEVAAKDAAVLPFAGDDIRSRQLALAKKSGLPYQHAANEWGPRFTGVVHLPTIELLLAGTRTQAPLINRECEKLAIDVGMKLLLLRWSPDHGEQLFLFRLITRRWARVPSGPQFPFEWILSV